MINITNASLEDVKQNPELQAQLLAEDFKKQKGSRGMLAYWQTVAKKRLQQKLSLTEARDELTQSFKRFVDNNKNVQRQQLLLTQLDKFDQQCQQQKFVWEDGQHQMKWELYAGVKLTGLTPIVVQDGNEYYAFVITEGLPGWQQHLRFPLFQQYLADYTLHCDIQELNVGIYDLTANQFQFTKYNAEQLLTAVNETSELFQQVQFYFNNLKKTANVLR